MLKRLLALFSKKPSAQKNFEEKLDRLSGGPTTPLHSDRLAERIRLKQQLGRERPAGNSPHNLTPVTRRQVEAPVRRGMSSGAQSDNGVRNDDAFLSGMMVQSVINNSVSSRHNDVDTCHTTAHHTPSHGGYDSSPSDGGGSYDGGGGSCD